MREAEFDAALTEVAMVMHTVTPWTESHTALGPMLTTEVEVEVCPIRALIDTGSPVTLVSLKCLVDVLAKQRPPEQSPSE